MRVATNLQVRARHLYGLRRGVPARVLVQDAGAVPVVRGQAVGGDGGAAGGGGARGGRARAVGLRHPEDAAAVLSAPPGAARRACAGGVGDGARADGRGGRRRGRCGRGWSRSSRPPGTWRTGTRTCTRWCRAGAGRGAGSGSRSPSSTSTRRSCCSGTRSSGCCRTRGCSSEERTELLLSWRHTGFSVHNRVRVEPEDQRGGGAAGAVHHAPADQPRADDVGRGGGGALPAQAGPRELGVGRARG